jgi:hypothetical protein
MAQVEYQHAVPAQDRAQGTTLQVTLIVVIKLNQVML